jgi:hypothetical protein
VLAAEHQTLLESQLSWEQARDERAAAFYIRLLVAECLRDYLINRARFGPDVLPSPHDAIAGIAEDARVFAASITNDAFAAITAAIAAASTEAEATALREARFRRVAEERKGRRVPIAEVVAWGEEHVPGRALGYRPCDLETANYARVFRYPGWAVYDRSDDACVWLGTVFEYDGHLTHLLTPRGVDAVAALAPPPDERYGDPHFTSFAGKHRRTCCALSGTVLANYQGLAVDVASRDALAYLVPLPTFDGPRADEPLLSRRELVRGATQRQAHEPHVKPSRPEITNDARLAPTAVRRELGAWEQRLLQHLHTRLRPPSVQGAIARLSDVVVSTSPVFSLRRTAAHDANTFVLELPRRALPALAQMPPYTFGGNALRVRHLVLTRPLPSVDDQVAGQVAGQVEALWIETHDGQVSLVHGRLVVDGTDIVGIVARGAQHPRVDQCVDATWGGRGIVIDVTPCAWPVPGPVALVVPADIRVNAPAAADVTAKLGRKRGSPRVAVMPSGRVVRDFDERFAEHLRVATRFAATHGHLLPTKRDHESLYKWLIKRDKEWVSGQLAADRRAALDALPAWHARLVHRGLA